MASKGEEETKFAIKPLDSLKKTSLVSAKQFTRELLENVFQVATKMHSAMDSDALIECCKGKILINLFYEPSTRTSCSFQAAMLRMGGQVIVIDDVKNSSVSKGETLEDTIRCLSSYGDVLAMRHPEIGAAKRAAAVSPIPILNGGDGAGEHPTQALLDMYTMLIEQQLMGVKKPSLDGLTITMVGDLKNGRTVHSLAQALALFKVKQINYVSPDILKMPKDLVDSLNKAGVPQKEYSDLSTCLADTDFLYVTRVQKERFSDENEYKKVADAFIITPKLLESLGAKSTLRIMHPLPRVNEISTELDSDPRAAYFRQMKYGMYVRMALIAMVLGKE